MVQTRRFRGGKKSKRHLHHKRRKHHSTHRRKVKRHSRRGTKRRQRTKRVKRGGARKYIMKGGGYYVITNDAVEADSEGYVVKKIPTNRGLRPRTKDPKDIQKRLNATPEMQPEQLADVTMVESGRQYAGKLGVMNVTINRYRDAAAANAAAVKDVAARDARNARKEKEGDMRAEMIRQLAQQRNEKVDRSAVLNAMQRVGHDADDGGWRNQHGLEVGNSGKT